MHMTDMNAYYTQLIGATITDFRFDSDELDEEPWPTFTVTMPDGFKLEVSLSRDPEGNGGGFAFIAPPGG
jgi:hypothetical protein